MEFLGHVQYEQEVYLFCGKVQWQLWIYRAETKQNRTGVNNMVRGMVNKEDAPELECITFARCGWIENRWWPSWASMSVLVVVESVPRWQALSDGDQMLHGSADMGA